jgi:protein gp37
MDNTMIEWCDSTWNPITGCTPVSEGCENCYAKRIVKRFPSIHGFTSGGCAYDPIEVDPLPFEIIRIHHKRLETPLRWKKPRRIFVGSMTDLFHNQVPYTEIDRIFEMMAAAKQHTFMILTKRPEWALEYFQDGEPGVFPYQNVWIGVTTENQAMADERMPVLLDIPAALRFVSIEPMLEPINIYPYLLSSYDHASLDHQMSGNECRTNKIDWVILGAETGPGRRPCKIEWMIDVVDQCWAAGVPVFVKQINDGFGRVIKNIDNFPNELRYREFPEAIRRMA